MGGRKRRVTVDASKLPSNNSLEEDDAFFSNSQELLEFDSTDDSDSKAFASALARVAWETKGEDILLLHVAPLVSWTSYMLIVTVFSRPQLNAILAKVTAEAKDNHQRHLAFGESNVGNTSWEVLDYGDVVVNILTAEQRDYYDLEGFYGSAEEVILPFLKESRESPAWQKRL